MKTGARRIQRGDPKRAIGIVRVSTSKQDLGAAAQRAELVRWAEREELDLIAIFEDIGVSGAAPVSERPGLIAAIGALVENRAGKLVAVKRDRFARHRHTIADVERTAAAAGAVLVTTDGVCNGEDTEVEEVNATIQDLVAALELRKIRARNLARARRCIESGRLHGGQPAYGQRRKKTGVTGRSGAVVQLEPDPTEQAIIARARQLRREGLSLRAVGQRLAEEGLKPRSGRTWQAMTIRRLVQRSSGAKSALDQAD
jgi:DNA invertase Pin-like site-specific DNA recombinase